MWHPASRHARFVLSQLLAKRMNFHRPLILVGSLALLGQQGSGLSGSSAHLPRAQLLLRVVREFRRAAIRGTGHFPPNLEHSRRTTDRAITSAQGAPQ